MPSTSWRYRSVVLLSDIAITLFNADACWMCSGQDRAREAREGPRGGEPHPADGAEGTGYREGTILFKLVLRAICSR